MTDIGRPPSVVLQPLQDEDAINLLAAGCPEAEEQEFYTNFVRLVYMSFSHTTKDLNEHRYLIQKLWPKYMEPINNKTGIE